MAFGIPDNTKCIFEKGAVDIIVDKIKNAKSGPTIVEGSVTSTVSNLDHLVTIRFDSEPNILLFSKNSKIFTIEAAYFGNLLTFPAMDAGYNCLLGVYQDEYNSGTEIKTVIESSKSGYNRGLHVFGTGLYSNIPVYSEYLGPGASTTSPITFYYKAYFWN